MTQQENISTDLSINSETAVTSAADVSLAKEPCENDVSTDKASSSDTPIDIVSSEVVAKPVEKNSSKSVTGMAVTAAVLIVIIGCWGYFITPKLGNKTAQPQHAPISLASSGDMQSHANKAAVSKEQKQSQDKPVDEVKISDQELALLEPPVFRKVSNPSLQRDIMVSQYMYARDYLAFAGVDVSYINELDKKAQEASASNMNDGLDELLVRQATEASVKMLQYFFRPKLETSKVNGKEELAKKAEQYFEDGDLSNGIKSYEKACGLNKEAKATK